MPISVFLLVSDLIYKDITKKAENERGTLLHASICFSSFSQIHSFYLLIHFVLVLSVLFTTFTLLLMERGKVSHCIIMQCLKWCSHLKKFNIKRHTVLSVFEYHFEFHFRRKLVFTQVALKVYWGVWIVNFRVVCCPNH